MFSIEVKWLVMHRKQKHMAHNHEKINTVKRNRFWKGQRPKISYHKCIQELKGKDEQLIEKIERERINRVSGLCGTITKFLPFISSEPQKERKKRG